MKTPGAEASECGHHVDEECECPCEEKICGPDVTDSLVSLMNFVNQTSASVGVWQAAFSDPGALAIKHQTKGLSCEQEDGKKCPTNCSFDAVNKFGCVTLCGKCVEGSMPGNMLFGFAVADALGTIAGRWQAHKKSREFHAGHEKGQEGQPDEDNPADHCAIDIGVDVASAVDAWIGRDKPVTREELCKRVNASDCLDECDCDPCTCPGQFRPVGTREVFRPYRLPPQLQDPTQGVQEVVEIVFKDE